jgi:beta-phosphoglucomutase-like phosphatase (HAD superfamily)
MKYKAIIFNFDGVIFDSEKLHLQACNQVFSELAFMLE